MAKNNTRSVRWVAELSFGNAKRNSSKLIFSSLLQFDDVHDVIRSIGATKIPTANMRPGNRMDYYGIHHPEERSLPVDYHAIGRVYRLYGAHDAAGR